MACRPRWLAAGRSAALVGCIVVLGFLAELSDGWTRVEDAHGADPVASGRVGAFYFDGWSGPLSNYHFDGLVRPGPNGQFAQRRPLSGWRDASLESMRTQLTWARQAGISFFIFDWYSNVPDPANDPLNLAHDNYLRLRSHQGVDFALLYVNHGDFAVPRGNWAAVVERWASDEFANRDYVRIDGKPLLVIYDVTLFREQWGGAGGVNAALATLRDAARRHGLPGVFVAGARYTDWFNPGCFPRCQEWDGGEVGLVRERYDALTDFAYPWAVEPVEGARPYGDVVRAERRNWDQFAEKSPVPYIPSVMVGWDPRPWNVRFDGTLLTWFTRSPADVGGFVKAAVDWVGAHPSMRVEPAPSRPVLFLQSWNELGEGAYVLPTAEDGYAYLQAIASAVGLSWSTTHTRRLTAKMVTKRVLAGALVVNDDWTPCDVERLKLQRRTPHGWFFLRAFSTKPGGSFSVALPFQRGEYRITAPQTMRYQQTCGAAMATVVRG
jgi:hypothetical protein